MDRVTLQGRERVRGQGATEYHEMKLEAVLRVKGDLGGALSEGARMFWMAGLQLAAEDPESFAAMMQTHLHAWLMRSDG